MLYITFPRVGHNWTTEHMIYLLLDICISISFIYFAQPSITLPSGKDLFLLHIYDSVSILFCSFIYFVFIYFIFYWNIVALQYCELQLYNVVIHSHEAMLYWFSSVQSLSRVRLFATPWIAAWQGSLSITNSRSSLRLTSIKSVMPSSHLILCRPLLLLSPIPPSIRVFSNESTLCMKWPKYWTFSFSISPSKEIPGLNSFRMDWLDLLAVQGTLKSPLQHYSSKSSILRL